MHHIGPLVFIAARSAVACLALAPLAYVEQRSACRIVRPHFASLSIAAGCAFFAGAALQQFGLMTASVTNTGFLTGLYVVLTPVIAWAALKRSPGAVAWAGVAISAIGTWLLGGGSLASFSTGDLLVALSAIFWSAHVVLLSFAGRHGSPILFTLCQFMIVGLIAGNFALLFEPLSLDQLWQARNEIAYVGLLSSALTFTLFTMALRHTPPSEAAILASAETLFAAAAGYAVLGERLDLTRSIGAGLIFSAIIFVQVAPLWKNRKHNAGPGAV